MISWSRLAFLAGVGVLAQVTFFDQTMLLDLARIDLPAFLLVGLANNLEPDPAAISGFGIGIVLDLFYSSPFGLFALLFCFSGWAIANITPVVDVADRFTRYAARAVEFGLLWLLTWFIGGVFGMRGLHPAQFGRALLDQRCGRGKSIGTQLRSRHVVSDLGGEMK